MSWFTNKSSETRLDNVAHTLPSYQEIIQLLETVDNSPYYKDSLYPLIASHAGEDVIPLKLVEIIRSTITTFCKDKPMGRALESLLHQKVHAFAKVLVDDFFFQESLSKLFPGD